MSIEVLLPTGVSKKYDSIPDETTKLAFVSAFIDAAQMRRLFTGSDSADVCKALNIQTERSEAKNCQAIEAYWEGE